MLKEIVKANRIMNSGVRGNRIKGASFDKELDKVAHEIDVWCADMTWEIIESAKGDKFKDNKFETFIFEYGGVVFYLNADFTYEGRISELSEDGDGGEFDLVVEIIYESDNNVYDEFRNSDEYRIGGLTYTGVNSKYFKNLVKKLYDKVS